MTTTTTTTKATTTITPDSRSLYKSKMQIAPLCVNRRTNDLHMHYAYVIMCVFQIEPAREREREKKRERERERKDKCLYVYIYIYDLLYLKYIIYICTLHANKTMCPPQCNHGKYQLPTTTNCFFLPSRSTSLTFKQACPWESQPALLASHAGKFCTHLRPTLKIKITVKSIKKQNELLNTAYMVYNNLTKKKICASSFTKKKVQRLQFYIDLFTSHVHFAGEKCSENTGQRYTSSSQICARFCTHATRQEKLNLFATLTL